ncbi:MAG: Na+/H+ antiporter subunit E [Candidatus Bipolaricaulia bacterium]
MALLLGEGLLFLLWLVLFGGVGPIIIVSGVLVAGLVVFLYGIFDLKIDIPLRSLARPLLWIKFFSLLVVEIGTTTVLTCYLILTGEVRGKIVAYETDLESGFGKLLLLNSITLTPITIGILSEKDLVYIHHLDLEDRDDYETLVERIRSTSEEPLIELLG